MATSQGTAARGANMWLRARRAGMWSALTVFVLCSVAMPARADFQEGAEAYARGDYQTAIAQWQPYAERGETRALFNLGQMYRLGIGTGKDLAKAESYYRQAAERGHIGAQANLGSMLFDRKPRQGADAVGHWRQAAKGGDAKSQYLLGIQYFNGEFVARDYVQGYAWLTLAAEAGIREAGDALATARSRMEPAAVQAGTKLAETLVVPLPPQASVAPSMPARSDNDAAAQLAGAVLRHPVEDLVPGELSPISPDAVRGAISLPSLEDFQPVTARAGASSRVPGAAAVPVSVSVPSRQAEAGSVEYRAQFASVSSESEALALRRTVQEKHTRLLGGAAVEVDTLETQGSQAGLYRVRSAPLKSEAAAKALCAAAKADRIVCQPAKTLRVPVAMKADPDVPAVQGRAARPSPPPAAAPSPAEPPATRRAEPPPAVAETNSDLGPQAVHAGDAWRVQVGAGRTEEEARFRWAILMGANADLLDAAELYIYKADLGTRGVFYRVQIGGFGTRPAAVGLCERLRTRKVECFVTATKQ